MPLVSRLGSLRRNLLQREHVDRDLAEELDAYLELLVEAKIAAGLKPEEARRAALIELGGMDQVKERVREVRVGHFISTLWQDLRYAVRMLLKKPGFTLVALTALALGIGANTAIFSVVNGVLLRPLPYRTADRLVFLSEWSQQVPNMSVSYPNFLDWQAQTTSFDALAAFRSNGFVLTGAGEPERLTAREVTQQFFPALGVAPALGRDFLPEEDRAGGSKTVLLSHGLWQRRFGGDPSVLGRGLMLNNESYTVVGVLPQTFEWQAPVDIFVPLGLRADRMQARGNHPGLYVVGLLKEGVSIEQAR